MILFIRTNREWGNVRNNGNYQPVWWLSGPFVTITFILFFPLGIILMLMRVSRDKEAAYNWSIPLNVIGVIFCLFALFMLAPLEGIEDPSLGMSLVLFIMFAICGITFLWKGIRGRKAGRFYTQNSHQSYQQFNQKFGQAANGDFREMMENLANQVKDGKYGNVRQSVTTTTSTTVGGKTTTTTSNTGDALPEDFANTMGAIFNTAFPSNNTKVRMNQNGRMSATTTTGPTPTQEKVVKCNACGAKSVIKSANVKYCEHCGSQL